MSAGGADRAADAWREIVGTDPRLSTHESELAAQRDVMARIVYDLVHNKGFEPITLCQSMIAGAAYLAEQAGVGRDRLRETVVRMLDGARLDPDGRSLIQSVPR